MSNEYCPNLYYFDTKDRKKTEFEKPKLSLEKVKHDYFGKKAFTYDLNRDGDSKWQKELDAVAACLEYKKGKVLDIPCGTGRFFSIYKSYGLDCVGMDVSEDMMVQARNKGFGYKCIPGDIMNIAADENEYDHTVCIRLLEKMTEDEMMAAIQEMARVTKSSMTLCLITGGTKQERNRSYVHLESKFFEAVESSGFKITKKIPIREPEMYVWHLESGV